MKIANNVVVEGNKVSLLFEEGTVRFNNRYWGKVDTILGFEYEVEKDNVSTKILVRDCNTDRFPDEIRRHMTTNSIKDFMVVGCDTMQEVYDAFIECGHNMCLLSTSYEGIKHKKPRQLDEVSKIQARLCEDK